MQTTVQNGREILNMNTNWLYTPLDAPCGAETTLDEHGWERVAIPHANRLLHRHKGADFQEQIDSYRFISWYRRHFALSESYRNKRLLVEFQGVATVAEVYVNAQLVMVHKGAYTTFTADITDFVHTDGSDNVLAVRVDATKHSDIPPEGGSVDYCLFGGIVRNVRLIVTDPVCIVQTFLTTPKLDASGGAVRAVVSLHNHTATARRAKVQIEVFDAGGARVTSASEEPWLEARSDATVTLTTPLVSAPHFWSTTNPYLYTAWTSVIDDGETKDAVKSKMGFRYYTFLPSGSFLLNGEPLKIVGVNRHEQWPWIGRAVVDKLQAADADLIAETGFNAVRCSHYPQSPAFLDRCDQLGLLVLAEAPGWQHIGDAAWKEAFKENLRELIVRDRNHPSIISWSVRVNESLDDDAFYAETLALVKSLDPTRPTHSVRRMETYESSTFMEDVFAANYTYPETPRYTPFLITEHSMDWSDGHGFPDASDTDAVRFLYAFADCVDYYFGNDLCAGGFAWSMFDYNNEVNYTKTDHVFYSGLYDLFRHDKLVAHFYRSQRDSDLHPTVAIANYWTPTSPATVTVLSNCDAVELFVNGKSQGTLYPNRNLHLPHPIYLFSDIAFEAGELRAVGYRNGQAVAQAVRRTPLAPAALTLDADYGALVADGADLTSVTITLRDENGTRLPYANNVVTISLEGPGRLIGESPVALEGGRMAFLVQSLPDQCGTITCTAACDGVADASVTIEVTDFLEATVPVGTTENL